MRAYATAHDSVLAQQQQQQQQQQAHASTQMYGLRVAPRDSMWRHTATTAATSVTDATSAAAVATRVGEPVWLTAMPLPPPRAGNVASLASPLLSAYVASAPPDAARLLPAQPHAYHVAMPPSAAAATTNNNNNAAAMPAPLRTMTAYGASNAGATTTTTATTTAAAVAAATASLISAQQQHEHQRMQQLLQQHHAASAAAAAAAAATATTQTHAPPAAFLVASQLPTKLTLPTHYARSNSNNNSGNAVVSGRRTAAAAMTTLPPHAATTTATTRLYNDGSQAAMTGTALCAYAPYAYASSTTSTRPCDAVTAAAAAASSLSLAPPHGVLPRAVQPPYASPVYTLVHHTATTPRDGTSDANGGDGADDASLSMRRAGSNRDSTAATAAAATTDTTSCFVTRLQRGSPRLPSLTLASSSSSSSAAAVSSPGTRAGDSAGSRYLTPPHRTSSHNHDNSSSGNGSSSSHLHDVYGSGHSLLRDGANGRTLAYAPPQHTSDGAAMQARRAQAQGPPQPRAYSHRSYSSSHTVATTAAEAAAGMRASCRSRSKSNSGGDHRRHTTGMLHTASAAPATSTTATPARQTTKSTRRCNADVDDDDDDDDDDDEVAAAATSSSQRVALTMVRRPVSAADRARALAAAQQQERHLHYPTVQLHRKYVNAGETEERRRRLEQRHKQIMYGKDTDGYRTYRHVVRHVADREYHNPMHPVTPRPENDCSKRIFDKHLNTWRRQLHQWDRCDLAQLAPAYAPLGVATLRELGLADEDTSRGATPLAAAAAAAAAATAAAAKDVACVALQSIAHSNSATTSTLTTAAAQHAVSNNNNGNSNNNNGNNAVPAPESDTEGNTSRSLSFFFSATARVTPHAGATPLHTRRVFSPLSCTPTSRPAGLEVDATFFNFSPSRAASPLDERNRSFSSNNNNNNGHHGSHDAATTAAADKCGVCAHTEAYHALGSSNNSNTAAAAAVVADAVSCSRTAHASRRGRDVRRGDEAAARDVCQLPCLRVPASARVREVCSPHVQPSRRRRHSQHYRRGRRGSSSSNTSNNSEDCDALRVCDMHGRAYDVDRYTSDGGSRSNSGCSSTVTLQPHCNAFDYDDSLRHEDGGVVSSASSFA